MSIDALNVLVGTWELTGRSAHADHDDVSGDLDAAEAILDGAVLQMTGTTRVGSFEAHSLEVVWWDDEAEEFKAHVYSGHSAPLDYSWAIDGTTLVHRGLGATYTGTISDDGNTIVGAWKADPDHPELKEADYDATMRRVG
jgi:hypothetical protein